MCLTASGLGTPDDIIQLKHTDNSKFVMGGEMLNAKSTTVQAVEPYEDDPDVLMVYRINFDSHRVYTLLWNVSGQYIESLIVIAN
mgnify:CR=1 FL=1